MIARGPACEFAADGHDLQTQDMAILLQNLGIFAGFPFQGFENLIDFDLTA